MTTLTQTPNYVLPQMTARTVVTATGTGANYVRIWCTDAPTDSALKKSLEAEQSSRVQVYKGKSGETWSFAPDKAGGYEFAVQEYTRGGITTVRSYENDTANAPTETQVGAESTVYIYAGQRLERTVGIGSDTATLVLHVWDDTIRQTTLALHGIKSPDIIAPTTARANTAKLDSTVATKLAALVDVAAATAIGNPSTLLTAQIAVIQAHYANATVHAFADADNSPGDSFLIHSASADGAVATSAEICKRLDLHMRNDNGGGTGSGEYHIVSGKKAVDWLDLPAVKTAAQLHDICTALATIYDSYEAHRVNTDVHSVADSTNTLSALPALYDVDRAFLSALRSVAPTSPATVNSGATTLVHTGGFRITN